jgi:hypothetical protein
MLMQNLATIEEYKTYSSINSTNHDAEINLLLPKISQLIKTYCRRSFVDYYDEAKVEVHSGGFGEILLQEAPVVQVISVQQSLDYGQTYTKLVKFQDWVLDGDVVRCISADQVFPKLINGYKISYFAGYEAVPQDLKLATLDLVTYYRKNDAAIHSTKAPGTNSVQIEYISTTSLPAHIKRVLDLYVLDYA